MCAMTGFEAFHSQRYWQTLQFGYLQEMAVHYRIPCSRLLQKITPQFLRKINIPYYASQTTVLARVNS